MVLIYLNLYLQNKNLKQLYCNYCRMIFAVAPVIRVTNQLVGSPLDKNVRLECIVESFPNSVNYWSNTKGEMILQG